MSNPSSRDPHQPYPDVTLSDRDIEVENVERMEGEGGHPLGSEGDLGPILSFHGKEVVDTPKTQPAEEGWADETAEGAREEEIVTPTARGCSCNCPGECPQDCPPSCQCTGHLRKKPTYEMLMWRPDPQPKKGEIVIPRNTMMQLQEVESPSSTAASTPRQKERMQDAKDIVEKWQKVAYPNRSGQKR